MPASHQKQRTLYILKILLTFTDEEHLLTAPEIAGILERDYGILCDRRTIYSEIEALVDGGYDIMISRGRAPGYYMASREFELAELKVLVDAVQSSRFITEKKSQVLIGKLETLCSRHEAKQLSGQVTIMNRPKTGNETIYYHVDQLHAAIYRDCKVTFQYASWNIKKELELRHDGQYYRVSPWHLVYLEENYYLVGFDEGAGIVKHYRVDKMINLSLLPEKRVGEEQIRRFDLAAFTKKTFGMFGGEDEVVTLRGEKRFAGAVIDHFGQEIWMRPDGEEHFLTRITVTVSPQFFAWLTGLGTGIEVVAPANVREEYREYLGNIYGMYQKPEL